MRWPTLLVFVLGCYAARATELTAGDQDELCLKAGIINLYYNYKAYYDCRVVMGEVFKTTNSKAKILQELDKKTEFVKHGVYTSTKALQLLMDWDADHANRFVAGVMSNKELDRYSKSDVLRRAYEFGGSIALWKPFLHIPFQSIFDVFQMLDYLLEKPTHYSYYLANYYNWLLKTNFDHSKVGCNSQTVMSLFTFLSYFDRRKNYTWRTEPEFLYEIFQLICDNKSVWTIENLYWVLQSEPLLDVHKDMLKRILKDGGGILKLTRNSDNAPANIDVDSLVREVSGCQEFENADIDETCMTNAVAKYRTQHP